MHVCDMCKGVRLCGAASNRALRLGQMGENPKANTQLYRDAKRREIENEDTFFHRANFEDDRIGEKAIRVDQCVPSGHSITDALGSE